MIGFGYDLHKLSDDKTLILGGVSIPNSKGTVAHSDGDVLLHSIIDAMLGATGLGDIGEHFPDTDMQYKNADSVELLKKTNFMIAEKQFYIVNIDVTILLEAPKLANYKLQIKQNIANILGIVPDQINIKAKTNEKQDSIGRQDAIAVYSVCQLEKKYI